MEIVTDAPPTPPAEGAHPDEVAAYQEAQTEHAMRAAGVAPEVKVQDDYFGTDVTDRTLFPDGITYVEHRVFNEGARKKYLNESNREVKFKKGSGDMVMRMQPGDDRHALLGAALVGWNLRRAGQPVAFSPATLRQFLEVADPKIIDLIEKDIRKANPWLLGDISVEDLDREIEALTELRATKLEEAAGKASS